MDCIPLRMTTNSSVCTYICICVYIHTYVWNKNCRWCPVSIYTYGVALASRIDKKIGLFCKRALQKRRYSAKETYDFIEPTDRSHPIVCMYTYMLKSKHIASRRSCFECAACVYVLVYSYVHTCIPRKKMARGVLCVYVHICTCVYVYTWCMCVYIYMYMLNIKYKCYCSCRECPGCVRIYV